MTAHSRQATCFASIAAIVATAAPAAAQGQLTELIERAAYAESAVKAAIRTAAEAAGGIVERNTQINADYEAKKNRAVDKLVQSLFDDYPGVFFALEDVQKDGKLLTDAASLTKILNTASVKIDKESFLSCFDRENESFRATDACVAKVKKSCSEYGASGDGRLFLHVLRDSLELEPIYVESASGVADIRKKKSSSGASEPEPTGPLVDLLRDYTEGKFAACKAASLAGQFFEPADIFDHPYDIPIAKLFFEPYTVEGLREQCLQFDVHEAYENFTALKYQYPNFLMLKIWGGRPERRLQGCQKAVQSFCGPAYRLKDEIIFAYVTQGCEVREVTAQDVDDDVARFAASGFTHADRLKHARLKELIDVCREASDLNYSWTHAKPSLASCSKTTSVPAKKPSGRKPKKPG